MPKLIVNDRQYPIDLVVFDKDGLLFQSQPFWAELANVRLQVLREMVPETVCTKWASVFGVQMEDGQASYIEPKGVFATASPAEEMAVTAGLIIDVLGLNWTDARSLAIEAFQKADAQLDLKKALHPQKGFPEIFHRLNQAGISYAVATSDTRDRVNRSLNLFDIPLPAPQFIITPEDVEHGKPFPDMLIECAKRANIMPDKIVMIGDSFVDVQMAREAGAIGIGIPETEDMREKMIQFAPEIVPSLDEILFTAE